MANLTVLSGKSVLETNSFCVIDPSYSRIFNNSFELGGMLNKSSASLTFFASADIVVLSFVRRMTFAGGINLVASIVLLTL